MSDNQITNVVSIIGIILIIAATLFGRWWLLKRNRRKTVADCYINGVKQQMSTKEYQQMLRDIQGQTHVINEGPIAPFEPHPMTIYKKQRLPEDAKLTMFDDFDIDFNRVAMSPPDPDAPRIDLTRGDHMHAFLFGNQDDCKHHFQFTGRALSDSSILQFMCKHCLYRHQIPVEEFWPRRRDQWTPEPLQWFPKPPPDRSWVQQERLRDHPKGYPLHG